MKKYIVPAIKVKSLDAENLLAGSKLLNEYTPTSNLDNAPGNGGENDGTHPVSAKTFNIWDDNDTEE